MQVGARGNLHEVGIAVMPRNFHINRFIWHVRSPPKKGKWKKEKEKPNLKKQKYDLI